MKKSLLPLSIAILALVIGVSACEKSAETRTVANKEASQPAAESAASAQGAETAVWRGTVLETMDVDNYTYVYLDLGKEKIWIAGPKTEMAVGQDLVVPKGMAMTNFNSKALDRTFDVIYFVGSFEGGASAQAGDQAMQSPRGDMSAMGDGSSHSTVAQTEVGKVAKADGGYTVEEILAGASDLAGRTVKVRGQVVKYTPNVMGTNWLHIQDGTPGDLAVTTSEVVAVGDIVLVEGSLTANKDLGSGYRYDAIIENAKVIKE